METSARTLNRRSLISGVIAAGVLCVAWLLPSADGEREAGGGSGSGSGSSAPAAPAEQPRIGEQ